MNYQLIKFAPVAIAAAMALTACGRQETPAPKTAAAPAPAPAPAPAAGSDMVKIGHVGPISGAIAHLGKDNENGARLAVEEINAAGGVKMGDKTVKLELLTGDDKADPKDGTLVAQKMIDDGVVALVGHLNSGTTIPASKLYSDANLSHISPSATAVKLTEQGFKTTFRVVARDDKQGAALANFAAGPMKAKTVAVIDDRTPYGQGLADEFEKFAKEKGLKVVGREFTNDKASDFNAILTKVRSMKPDVVMY
ncbi:MAG TPA: branched-chain amino acid ABC transporter substrate-binding protein, partial [Burkholderiaceae bacterium]|nr:branched-chain amino acid ABC transporter substrate-binding protein [Burkholderiaceae bacterium]